MIGKIATREVENTTEVPLLGDKWRVGVEWIELLSL